MSRSSIEQLCEGSRHEPKHLALASKAITKTYRECNRTLQVSGGEHPMIRLALIASHIDLVANCDLDPCFELTHENVMLPQRCIQQYYNHRAANGLCEIVPIGHRDIYVIERPMRREAMQILEQITDNMINVGHKLKS